MLVGRSPGTASPHPPAPCTSAVGTTPPTPATAPSPAAGSRRSARPHSAPPSRGGCSNHVARTLQPCAGARRTSSRPRYPHPPVTNNRCTADESLPSHREPNLTRQTPTDDWPTTGVATGVSRDTLVRRAPPPPPAAPPP